MFTASFSVFRNGHKFFGYSLATNWVWGNMDRSELFKYNAVVNVYEENLRVETQESSFDLL